MDALEPVDDDVVSTEEEECVDTVLTVAPSVSGSPSKRRTMRLHGVIDNKEVLILVDSGSVATFVSTKLADQLQS